MEPTDYYDLTRITDVAVSPSGERAAFVAAEFDGREDERRSSVFVAPTDGSAPPHRLTRASDASAPAWSPDGSALAVLAAREEDAALAVGRGPEGEGSDGGEPETQVWAFDLDRGGDARRITDRGEGVREFDWGPRGERLVIAARDPTDEQREYLERREEGGPVEVERLQHRHDGTGWLDEVPTRLFVVDVADREERRLEDAWDLSIGEAADGLHPRWHPRGERIAFRANRTDAADDSYAMDLFTVGADGGETTRHTDGDLTVTAPRWSPDGERLAFVGRDAENWYIPSEVYVLEGGEYRSVSGDLDRPIARDGAAEWLEDGELLAPIGDEGLTRLCRFHADGAPPERSFDAQGDGRTVAAFDLGGGTAGVALSHPEAGTDLFAVDAPDGDPIRLSAVNDDLLGDADLPACERVAFESDGARVEGLAYLPPGFDPDDPEARPLILKIHGGPIAYDAPEFRFEYAHWAGEGYVVLNVNYRGSASYGREFSETIRGEWGPKETADVIAGAEALVERGWADPERLYVTGFSYGAMTTAHAVATTDRFAAAAAEHGVYDYRSAFGTDDQHKWWENDFGLPWERPEAYEAASSITDVDEIETPLLVTAGGDDWRCPPSQSEQLYVSVKKRGVESRLVVYPDEHHDVVDPDRAVHRLRELTGWFEDHA